MRCNQHIPWFPTDSALFYGITKRPLWRALCNKNVATALCAMLRPQNGGYDYGFVVVVVVSVSFFS